MRSFSVPDKWMQIARILSLDVVLGALASGGMVATWLQVAMPWVWWIALPLSVWVIYTADHLLDAYRLQDKASTPRHFFHHQFFWLITCVWAIGLVSCLTWIPYFAPKELWYFGFAMGGVVLIHLGLVFLIGNRTSWLFIKELGVGGIYCLGVWGGPLIFAWGAWPRASGLLFGQFFLLALINLLVFSWYEHHIDERDGHTSFVRAIGPQRAQWLIFSLILMVVALGVTQVRAAVDGAFWRIQACYGLMLLVLGFVAFGQT
ncbi:MAG: hypothetical protein AAF804_17570, partial [Bacteroidota bacterium]